MVMMVVVVFDGRGMIEEDLLLLLSPSLRRAYVGIVPENLWKGLNFEPSNLVGVLLTPPMQLYIKGDEGQAFCGNWDGDSRF